MDPSRDLRGDRGHVQDQQELGPRSFGQKLMLPQASKVAFNPVVLIATFQMELVPLRYCGKFL